MLVWIFCSYLHPKIFLTQSPFFTPSWIEDNVLLPQPLSAIYQGMPPSFSRKGKGQIGDGQWNLSRCVSNTWAEQLMILSQKIYAETEYVYLLYIHWLSKYYRLQTAKTNSELFPEKVADTIFSLKNEDWDKGTGWKPFSMPKALKFTCF